MAAWIRRGMRVDVELAVALEIGALRFAKAETARDRDTAIGFNRRLWQAIRQLAVTAPEVEDRNGLLDSADQVMRNIEDSRTVSHHNSTHARVLAGRAATQGALKHLLEDWRIVRQREPLVDFGDWLLSRLDMEGAPVSLAA